ncbi:MAG: UDP-N-acetylmuramate dehydrogenase [candidate division Zixibacteria bacterium]|jgi:UDP-N-acetylmuramate dehydrogenase|nr:UDP-N-acetylmuramate dehydrogenase [candidate division Zixibacteria bacterium]
MAKSHMLDKSGTSLFKDLSAQFGSKLIREEPLSRHTTFGVGGPADLFIEVTSADEMVTGVNLCEQHGQKYFIIGGGSNLLVSDNGYHGVVLKSSICHYEREGTDVIVGSGFNLEEFVDRVCSLGLAGAETLAGIKGTVGGAVYGNAGAYGGSISDCFVSAKILKPGEAPRVEGKNYFEFSYRNSILKRTREIVLEVSFRFLNGSSEQLLKKKQEILQTREEKHPTTDCSAGCFFKNIEKPDEKYGKLSTGMLLERVGAKEITFGKAGVFPYHANILVNLGGAKADDIRELAMILKKKVKDQFGYSLEEEITYLGDFN